MTKEKEYKFWTILQWICLFSLLAFWAVYIILELVFDIYTPGWVFFIVTVLLMGTFGACITIRGQLMIENGKTNRGTVDGNLGVTMLPKPGPVMDLKSFEILQVHSNGQALAYSSDKVPAQPIIDYHGPTVLFLPDKNQPYYDHLVITVPEGKIVRQVGTYRYKARDGVKTVPIISFQELNK